MKRNILKEKSFDFAVEVIATSKELTEQREFVLSRQFARSGTAIGALVREAEFAESKADFIHKLSISLKESNETEYWVELIHKSSYIDDSKYRYLRDSVGELNRLLITILKTSRENLPGHRKNYAGIQP